MIKGVPAPLVDSNSIWFKEAETWAQFVSVHATMEKMAFGQTAKKAYAAARAFAPGMADPFYIVVIRMASATAPEVQPELSSE